MKNALLKKEKQLAVVGLGYVGIPLATAFSEQVSVIGLDSNEEKIAAYKNGIDPTGELLDDALQGSNIGFTSDPADLKGAGFIIVAVPTPIHEDKRPDLELVLAATRSIGKHMSKGAIVVYESTVYPGVTEELCLPILEEESGLRCGVDFSLGYSPERVNPGDKINRLENICKVVSGIDAQTLNAVAEVYELIITSGVFRAGIIKAAEAIKLIENTQRDVNIAFMNEVSVYCNLLGIDTRHVVEGMRTKWNALNFKPGLVGGHCIGVDPYYLIYQADKHGYYPNITLSSRRLNDKMPDYVADMVIRQLIASGKNVREAKIYVMGATFKENCGDVRNAKSLDVLHRLESYGFTPFLCDPIADAESVEATYQRTLVPFSQVRDADCVIFAVGHNEYRNLTYEAIASLFSQRAGEKGVLIDVSRIFIKHDVEELGLLYWGL